MLSRMPRYYRRAARTHLAAAFLALTSSSTPTALSFSSAHHHSRSSFVRRSSPLPNTAFWNSLQHQHRGGGNTLTTASMSSTTATTDETATAAPVTTDPKLTSLRERMKKLNMDVYLVPSDDPHLSEYTPDCYKRRAYLSGFQGSAGTAVVTQDEALMWTDSRYFNEASLQLDANHWKLMKSGQPKVPTIVKFLADMASTYNSEHGKPLCVGMDPYVHSASFAKELEDAFAEESEEESSPVGVLDTSHENLIDPIWGDERPPVPQSPFRVHPIEYAGKSVQEKVDEIRKEMETKKATLAVFCTLDDVAYLLNVRAMGDVETCPVGIAYATVSNDDVTLYCDSAKVQSPEIKQHLSEVTIKPYDAIVEDIQEHCTQPNNKVWIDKSRANYAISSVIPKENLVDAQNAVTSMKGCKNEAEMEGMRQAHIVDGAAMAKFMAWLEHAIVEEGRSVSEVEIDEKLTGFRAEQPGFLEVSFPTIAGVGSNGAIIHYRATEGSDLTKSLDKSNPILIDSGGQYMYGTTDVTRTWHFGTPTPEFVEYYTRVLKGNIGVDSMIFPENTPGFVLDVFARKALWEAGKDYGHGTGHGVGAALNVHEGPHSISPRWANKEVLKKGMVVSNEPGYYEDGNFGIRIENLLEIRYVNPEDDESVEGDDDESAKSADKKFLKFDKLTLIPIQKNLIDVSLVTDEELDWLDSYHELVLEKVGPLLEPDSPAMAWLEKSCAKIERNRD